MLNGIKNLKPALRAYMQQHYSDEKLVALLAHARDGKLAYHSCCCFAGVPSAKHALQGRESETDWTVDFVRFHHGQPSDVALPYRLFTDVERVADHAYWELSHIPEFDRADKERRRLIIPLIRAELWRRTKVRQQQNSRDEDVVRA